MKKRVLWYVCLGAVLTLAGQAILQAQSVAKDPKADNVQSAVSTKGTMPKVAQPQTAAEVDRDAVAQQAYDRMIETGTVVPGEKGMILEYLARTGADRGTGGALDNVGGPDGFGYRFVDNVAPDTATYDWVELRGDAGTTWLTTLDGQDDAIATIANMGITFPFYGNTYSAVTVCTNGHLQFGGTATSYSNTALPATAFSAPTIMPYWDDLNANYGGITSQVIGWKNFGDYTVIEWDSVGHCCTTGPTFKFEAILYTSGAIKIQYNNMVFGTYTNTSTVGIQGASTGTNFLQFVYNGSPSTNEPANGRAVWFFLPPPQDHDFAVSAITSPGTGTYEPNTFVTVTASVRNFGLTTESSPVKYSFNGGATVSEMTGTLAQWGTESHTFTTQIQMPAADGAYPLTVWTELPGDGYAANDTLRRNVNVLNCTRPLPWTENFDGVTAPNLPPCFTTVHGNGAGGGTWVTTSSYGRSTPNAAYVAGYYRHNDWLFTPAFNLSASSTYTLIFYYRGYSTSYNDSLEVKYGTARDSLAMTNTLVARFKDNTSTTYAMRSVSFTPPADGNYVIGFHSSTGASSGYSVIIDDANLQMGEPTGRCCYGNPVTPTCADNSQSACTGLGGTWNPSVTCASSPCPSRPANDNCDWITPSTLPATWTGNVNNATHDCPLITTGNGEVWHAFTLSECSNVTIDFCNTNSAWNSFATALYSGCPCASSTSSSSSNYTACTNGNITIAWNAMQPGTYYYPVYWYPTSFDTGAYSINVSAIACPPPPANDLCANATPLSGNVIALAWNNQAAIQAAENTYCSMYRDIWYCWSTPCEVDVNVTTCGSSFDTKLAVYNTDASCTCPTGTGIACNDDSTCTGFSLNSALSFHAVPGRYMIQVGSFSSTGGGAGVLNINTSALCFCDSATDVTVYADPNNAGHEWVHFNAPATNGRYRIYSTTVKNNDGDPRNNDPNFTLAGTVIASATGAQVWQDTSALGLYKNYVIVHDCAALGRCCYGDVMNPSCTVDSRVECDALQGLWTANADCNTPCPVPHVARCCYGDPSAPTCATNAHFQCNALGGVWDSLLTCEANPCPVRPANDDCSGAIAITGTVSGDNSAATGAVTPVPTCPFSYSKDMWYTYTPTATGNAIFNTCTGTTWDSWIDVLTGTCGSFTSIACNDDGCSLQSSVTVAVTAGTTYYVRVGCYGSTAVGGPFTLTVVNP